MSCIIITKTNTQMHMYMFFILSLEFYDTSSRKVVGKVGNLAWKYLKTSSNVTNKLYKYSVGTRIVLHSVTLGTPKNKTTPPKWK